jgi:hypothetical protein
MRAASSFYSVLAVSVLLLHALFILWVVFGALVTRSHPILRSLHLCSLTWGILTELLPWPCPLTVLENWLEAKAGVQPYQGGFLLHYLDKVVYPDISATVLTIAGVIICALNLTLYGQQMLDCPAPLVSHMPAFLSCLAKRNQIPHPNRRRCLLSKNVEVPVICPNLIKNVLWFVPLILRVSPLLTACVFIAILLFI